MCQSEIDISVNEKEESTMEIKRVGVDSAKNVFQLHGADRKDKTVWIRKLSSAKWYHSLLSNMQLWVLLSLEVRAFIQLKRSTQVFLAA
jgi:hypothetical protein